MKVLLLFTNLLFHLPALAQDAGEPVGAVSPLLQAYSTQFATAFSFRANSASLASVSKFSSCLYSERRFLLQELSNHSMAAALPTTSGTFGLRAHYSGSAVYHTSTLGLAYGRKLGEQVKVGAQFLYHNTAAAGYGGASTLTVELGTLVRLSEGVQAGVSVANPAHVSSGKEQSLPVVYAAGLGWDVSPQAFLGAQFQKTEGQPLAISAGFRYNIAGSVFADAGLNTGASVYSLGFGVGLRSFQVAVTAAFHPYLGTTPGLLLMYSPK